MREEDGELLAADPVYDAVELFQVGTCKPCGWLFVCVPVCAWVMDLYYTLGFVPSVRPSVHSTTTPPTCSHPSHYPPPSTNQTKTPPKQKTELQHIWRSRRWLSWLLALLALLFGFAPLRVVRYCSLFFILADVCAYMYV